MGRVAVRSKARENFSDAVRGRGSGFPAELSMGRVFSAISARIKPNAAIHLPKLIAKSALSQGSPGSAIDPRALWVVVMRFEFLTVSRDTPLHTEGMRGRQRIQQDRR